MLVSVACLCSESLPWVPWLRVSAIGRPNAQSEHQRHPNPRAVPCPGCVCEIASVVRGVHPVAVMPERIEDTPAVHPAADDAVSHALIVDDDDTNRLVLAKHLERLGMHVLEARDGAEGVAVFDQQRPDIVFMDVMMPVMDGYEATRRIKEIAGDNFVPVIFLTALTDANALLRCVECGGDDFLTKPFNHLLMRARVNALLRIRQLYQTVHSQAATLALHKLQQDRELEVAEQLFSNVVHSGCLDDACIRYQLSAMSVFNGDILVAARTPGNALRVLLGDFTGHGLAAGIGALPVAEVFYGMTAKGFAIPQLLGEVHRKLLRVLPRGRFFAATVFELDADHTSLAAFNAGMPDLLVLDAADGTVRERVVSEGLPLAAGPDMEPKVNLRRIPLRPGDRLLAFSDGLSEALDPDGEMFGEARLEQALSAWALGATPFDRLAASLNRFRRGESQNDDMAVVEVLCGASDPSPEDVVVTPGAGESTCWSVGLEFGADTLRRMDPLPMLSHMLLEYQHLNRFWNDIYTVLTELLGNAIDHGMLGLDSSMRRTPEGFSRYYEERERRLAALVDGKVGVRVANEPQGDGGLLQLTVHDSGAGFDISVIDAQMPDNPLLFSGRGIALVRSLCERLEYSDAGRRVDAYYQW